MRVYDNKEECTGCGACINVCPQHCISLEYDPEGFLYPKVDEGKCIQCNLCRSKCHMRKNSDKKEIHTEKFYAAFCKNGTIMEKSSSGGAFSALAYCVIQKAGVVYGVTQESLFDVRHQRAETWEECKKFRKSKYLESNTGDIFCQVKKDLLEGREVLFSGTGCQIAGLYSYLGEKRENLFTCEVVCHGVPSMSVFQKYITELEHKYQSKVSAICFRDKKRGWIPNFETISFQSGKRITCESGKNPFHHGYLNGLYSRPSCGSCRYASLPRIADITLADFWRYSGRLKKENENRGISLAVLSTEAGVRLFERASVFLEVDEARRRDVVISCHHLTHAPEQSRNRSVFFQGITKKPFWYLIKRYSKD